VPRLIASALVLLALLGILAPARAVSPSDVFVYRGTVRAKTSLEDGPFVSSAQPAVARAYLVVNYATGQSGLITYFVKNGKKQVIATEQLYATRGKLQNGRPATLLANANSNPPDLSGFPPNRSFSFRYLGFRGQDASLRIETTPMPRNVDRPRVLKGVIFSTTSPDEPDTQDGTFSEATFNGSLESALTIDANNNDKTVLAVLNEISARLATQGYPIPD
jgi:hypothetical protein